MQEDNPDEHYHSLVQPSHLNEDKVFEFLVHESIQFPLLDLQKKPHDHSFQDVHDHRIHTPLKDVF